MRLAEIHRYPVKSMQGERLMSAGLGELGIPGDRAWALREAGSDGATGAKRLPALMAMGAQFVTEPTDDQRAPEVRIRPETGTETSSAAADVHQRLSAALNHPVTLAAATNGGHHFDAYPLLIITRSSLRALADQAAALGVDPALDLRRFRPNLLLETDQAGFLEDGWVGRTLRLGEALLQIETRCPRCVMTTHGFDEVPREPRVMRALVQGNEGNLGVYATVRRAGRVRVGDDAALL